MSPILIHVLDRCSALADLSWLRVEICCFNRSIRTVSHPMVVSKCSIGLMVLLDVILGDYGSGFFTSLGADCYGNSLIPCKCQTVSSVAVLTGHSCSISVSVYPVGVCEKRDC